MAGSNRYLSALADAAGDAVPQSLCSRFGGLYGGIPLYFTGSSHLPTFCQAWQRVIDRYDVFRTGFIWTDVVEPLQYVRKQLALPFTYYDWQELDPQQQQHQISDLLASEQQGFDLTQPPLMRLTLVRLTPDRYELIWTHHHLLLDGWSLPLVFKEVFADVTDTLQPTTPYRNYIAWLQAQDLASAKSFWQAQLQGITAPTPLLALPMQSAVDGYQTLERRLAPAHTAIVQEFARQHHLTVNNLIQGVWALLLSRYSGERDVVFGVTVSGRPPALPGVEEIVGLFINTLPMRVTVADDLAVVPWLQTLQVQQQEIDRYSYTPLIEIQGWSDVPRSENLFDSIVVFENYPIGSAVSEQPNPHNDLQIANVDMQEQTNYPLNLTAIPGQSLTLEISFDRSRFTPETIAQMLDCLEHLVMETIADPQKPIGRLSLLSPDRQQQLIRAGQGLQHTYPAQCIHQAIEAQTSERPDAVALVWDERRLTYQELNEQANQLAHYLQAQGVTGRVGIYLERSGIVLVAVLAILKIGATYVPLDPSYPVDRLTYMLTNAEVNCLITTQTLATQLPHPPALAVYLDRDWAEISNGDPHNLDLEIDPEQLAYVIYTSGSTGTPKGVMVSHRNLVNAYHGWEIAYRLKLIPAAIYKWLASLLMFLRATTFEP
ncbi:MAG: AMP-binding protein [Chamaesiphon sp. CSU_1_12]|nr:AMP-binding protein [Chamaesiphon sp. CSU_1_12]